MQAPDNLVKAVERIQPRAVLLLDTNTVMDAPQLDSYEVNSEGQFLLVIPQLSYSELMSLSKGGRDNQTRRKADRALRILYRYFEQGKPDLGIQLGDGRWFITVETPSPPQTLTLEQERFERKLGKVDSALLRLGKGCETHLPNSASVLITRDKNLTGVVKISGLSACPLQSLRSAEFMTSLLGDVRIGETRILEEIDDMLTSGEEIPVKVAMTLEELRSEGALRIARGFGQLIYDGERFPFHWTFPYEDLGKHMRLWEIGVPSNEMGMPLGNLTFVGDGERVPDTVKRIACRMLEDSADWASGRSLQSPLTTLRFALLFHSSMAMMRGELGIYRDEARQQPPIRERYDRRDKLIKSILAGEAENVGDAYRSAFQLEEEMDEILGYEEEYDNKSGLLDLETSLIELLSTALGTWSVGETREEDFTHTPFAWLEPEEDTHVENDDEFC